MLSTLRKQEWVFEDEMNKVQRTQPFKYTQIVSEVSPYIDNEDFKDIIFDEKNQSDLDILTDLKLHGLKEKDQNLADKIPRKEKLSNDQD